MPNRKRITLLTLMQVFGCICVVFGHSYPFVTMVPAFFVHLQLFIYSFHMPLFVFCSGVLLQLSCSPEKYSFWQFTKKRFLRLLLPYFVFSALGILPKILLSPMLNDSLSFDFFELFRAIFVPRENIWGHFWFLPMIFFCGLIGYWLSRLFRRLSWIRWVVLVLSFVAAYLPKFCPWLAIDDIVGHLFYYVLGMNVAELYLKTDSVKTRLSACFGAVILLSSIIIYILGAYTQSISYLKPILACFMIAATTFILLPLSRHLSIGSNSILNRSYSIFILSWPCQLVVELVMERILQFPFWCITPCMFVVGLLIPCVLIKLIDRLEKNKKNKILSRIIGG